MSAPEKTAALSGGQSLPAGSKKPLLANGEPGHRDHEPDISHGNTDFGRDRGLFDKHHAAFRGLAALPGS